MNDSKKIWSVTYTRHIKQKRKLWKDGSLHHNISNDKLLLYDDSQNLLECRLLKTDELVSPGETLSFQSYSVDVGDPQNEASDFNAQVKKGSNVSEVPRVVHRKKFKSPVSLGNRKDSKEEFDVKKRSDLSSSEKIIKEFKKTEFGRYGVQKCSPNKSNSTVKEWQVLYTTCLTQKAKKYHDGFLQLASSGSFRKQIHLYDACRKLLTSRFLRTDETLVSGESISLDGYLVEIGDAEGGCKPKVNLNSQRSNCNANGEIKTRQAQESKHHIDLSDIKEWQVMYTTQLTQKAKKYHDGFLRLENCGSLTQKILLYDSSKTLLNSRFIKKDEMIKYGESISFDAHLVDVGEPMEYNKPKEDFKANEHGFNVSAKTVKKTTLENYFEAKKTLEKDKLRKSQNTACFKLDIDSRKTSGTDGTSPAKITTKPLRDVHQILAFLQRPIGIESNSMCNSSEIVDPPDSNAKGLECSELEKNLLERDQTPRAPPPNYREDENQGTEGSNVTMHKGKTSILSSSKATSTFSSNGSDPSDSVVGIHQSQLGNTETGTISYDESFASCIKELSSAHTDVLDDHTKTSEQREMDEWPSFDLGF